MVRWDVLHKVNVIPVKYGATAWRLQLGSAFIPTVPLLALIYFCPESPSQIIKSSGNYCTAFESLRRLRNTELQAARDLYYMYTQQRVKVKFVHTEKSLVGKVLELFTIPRNRRAAYAACTVMLSQQLCGSMLSCLLVQKTTF